MLTMWAARSLYVAQVDPHLTYATEVCLDVDDHRLRPLENIQRNFLRRALGLSATSPIVVLFTETGLQPLRYRRALLALNYLRYLLSQCPTMPSHALSHSIALARQGSPCWITDLHHTLASLPHPVPFDYFKAINLAAVDELVRLVNESALSDLRMELQSSQRLTLLRDRTEWCPKKMKLTQETSSFRLYLHVYTAEHRRALTRLLASEHPLAIQRLRHAERYVPRELRICRFCCCANAIEDEAHVLIDCLDNRLVCIREPFMARAIALVPALLDMRRHLNGRNFLLQLISRAKIVELLAEYVYSVFELCERTPLYLVNPAA